MIDKLAKRAEVQRVSQSVQTEPETVQIEPQQARPRQQRASMLDGKNMIVRVRKTGIELSFK
jgi:hypothetical protein